MTPTDNSFKVSVTIPVSLLERFDLLAERLDRKRHWLMVRALQLGLPALEAAAQRQEHRDG